MCIRDRVYLDKKIVNTIARKEYVLHNLIPKLNKFKEETGIELHTSGMPYIRTLNAKTIVDEIGIFIGAALLITSLIFFFFFRSFRATLISLVIVIIGVMSVSYTHLDVYKRQYTFQQLMVREKFRQ